ncbi:MAG TPA: hypothetical protein VK425_11735 [Acidimicrobiales bacterium]|nr:hypothetical protein [Acidimicrobiales bacterium]
MPTPVFYGLAIASVGGPLALITIFLPNTLADVSSSAGLLVLLGALAFVFPTAVWYRFARSVASSGGLYSFVEHAAGTTVARLHGAIWVVSYFLYLPSTVVFVLYDVLPAAFPGVAPYRAALNIAVPAAMVVGLVLWRSSLFTLTAGLAFAQVVLVGVLAGSEISHAGNRLHLLTLHASAGTAWSSVGSVSLLFVCSSLPLYLGAEVRHATKVTSRALPLAVGAGAVCAIAGVVALARFSPSVLAEEVPGWDIATSVGGHALGDAVVLGTAASVLTLVLLEYVAITRLLPVMVGVGPRSAEIGVGAVFIGASAISLANPQAAYEKLVNPSLMALYLSEVIVFLVYPLWRRRRGKLRAPDIVLTVAASALMLYGLYNALKPSTGL